MSRREEVEKWINTLNDEAGGLDDMEYDTAFDYLSDTARTLADEVDARDAIIDKLLTLLEPKKPCPKHEDFMPFDYNKWNDATCAWMRVDDLHARACEIAGRNK